LPTIIININISKEELLKYYRGTAATITARASNGKTIRFPADSIRPFVSQFGVSGQFEIVYSDAGKLENIKKIS